MQDELRSHKIVAAITSGWLLVFLYVVFIGSRDAETHVKAELILVLNLVVGIALAYTGMSEIIVSGMFGLKHRKELTAYLVLGLLSLLLGMGLALGPGNSLVAIARAVAPYGVMFGLAQLRVAKGLSRHPRREILFYLCGSFEMLCGFLLAAGHLFGDRYLLRLLALTAVGSLLQLAPFLVFRPQKLARSFP